MFVLLGLTILSSVTYTAPLWNAQYVWSGKEPPLFLSRRCFPRVTHTQKRKSERGGGGKETRLNAFAVSPVSSPIDLHELEWSGRYRPGTGRQQFSAASCGLREKPHRIRIFARDYPLNGRAIGNVSVQLLCSAFRERLIVRLFSLGSKHG